MEEVCKVVPKSLQKYFEVEEIFLEQNVSRYFSV